MRPLTLRPLFLSALALLVLNDLALKRLFPGFATGKLSDLAGLYAFVVFFAGCVPRWRVAVGAVTAIGFTWFKSPWSSPVIESLGLTRVVDASDLVALLVIPLAVHHVRDAEPPRVRLATVMISVVSIAAFMGTSRARETFCCESTWRFPMTPAELHAAIDHYPIDARYGRPRGEIRVIHARVCGHPLLVMIGPVTARGLETEAVIELIYQCREDLEEEAWAAFRKEIAGPLEARRVDRRVDRIREWWTRLKGS